MPDRHDMLLGDLAMQPDRVAQVVTAYYRDLMQHAVRMYLLYEAEAEGIVQQVFLELCDDLQQGIRKPDVPVRAWLFQRLRQRCLNYIERERARYTDADAAIPPQVIPFRTLDEMMHHDLITCLRAGVTQHLQGRTRDVMHLYMQGLAPKAIAAELHISPARVSQLMRKGEQQLRAWLLQHGYDAGG